MSHLYKLFERLILNRVGPAIDSLLIPERAGFRPGKSTTSQVLNLTQLIEDGFEERKVTGVELVDLSAAYDTVNHRCLLHKNLDLTKDIHLTEVIESMLENRHFFVELEARRADGGELGMGFHRVVYLHHYYSTSTPMISLEVPTHSASSMQMTFV